MRKRIINGKIETDHPAHIAYGRLMLDEQALGNFFHHTHRTPSIVYKFYMYIQCTLNFTKTDFYMILNNRGCHTERKYCLPHILLT